MEGQVPAGTVAFFDLSTCPSGWTELEEARGRAIVGLNGSAGTLRATVGTSLADRENRSHTHEVNVESFTSGGGGAHNHQWMENGDTFTARSPATAAASASARAIGAPSEPSPLPPTASAGRARRRAAR